MRLARWASLFCMPTGRFGARSPGGGRRWIDRDEMTYVHRHIGRSLRQLPAARAPPAGPCAVGPSFVRSRRVRSAVCLRPGRPDVSPAARIGRCMHALHSFSVSPATFFTVAVTGSTICPPISTGRTGRRSPALAFALGFPCMHGHDRTSCTGSTGRCVCI